MSTTGYATHRPLHATHGAPHVDVDVQETMRRRMAERRHRACFLPARRVEVVSGCSRGYGEPDRRRARSAGSAAGQAPPPRRHHAIR